jgi:predicted kinase
VNKQLIIIRGVQGSGKSTLAGWICDAHEPRALVPSDWVHYEADMYFINPITGEYKWVGEEISKAHRWCEYMVDAAMKNGKNVIVSNTFVKKEDYKVYEEMAQQYGYSVQIIICQGKFQNTHGVPEEKVEQKRKQFEY